MDAAFETPFDEWEEKAQDQIDHSRYSKLALRLDEDGWLPLVRAAYDDEKLTDNNFAKRCSLEDWINVSDDALSTVEPAILKAICSGDVNATVKGDSNLRKVIQSYEDRADSQAKIFLRQMTVGVGQEALSVTHARNLALVAMQYANQDNSDSAADMAYEIDKKALDGDWHIRYTISGRRYFIEGSKGDVDVGKKRVLQGFSCALTRLADQTEKDNKAYIPFLQFVGYASKGHQDRSQHGDTFTGTSSLLAFTKCCLETWKNFNPVEMHDFTICLIPDDTEGPVAYMLLARLARAYYFAGGLSIGQAAGSMLSLSLSKFKPQERGSVWMANTQWVKDYANYDKTLEKEVASRTKLQKAEYEAGMSADMEESTDFKTRLQSMREAVEEIREEHRLLDDWQEFEENFPDEYQEFKELEKFAMEMTKALAEVATS
ncbi:uncharacterized protein J4E88_007199 [Alternaria novae-zelandiae]|uniref:uncharacterized protein n=1 Tax=Alternaria novae-zelandiae TaxID=430562 RepID=UPI0020C1D357|nr:uncharacterized protein J4E88_007199 [Alternaria novae-zelandiae]KAI4676285.1 hypothetical protein J4E88_007199 [Alternaria novae-zelandiae]